MNEDGLELCETCKSDGFLKEEFCTFHVCPECKGAGELYWIDKLMGNSNNAFNDKILRFVETSNTSMLEHFLNRLFESDNIMIMSHMDTKIEFKGEQYMFSIHRIKHFSRIRGGLIE
jgi:excinuclease UvrABC ATPase subunit